MAYNNCRRLIFYAIVMAFSIAGVSCDGTKNQVTDRQSAEETVELPIAKSSGSEKPRDRRDDPEYKALLAKGDELASLSPQERRARWFDDDPLPRNGQSIGKILPQVSEISAISANLTDDDGDSVHVQIPKSKWHAFYEILSDSEPVELESEILIIAFFKISMVDGTEFEGAILSMFANPVFFAIDDPKNPTKRWIYFATTQSELKVLDFFEPFRDKPSRNSLRGWFPYRHQ